MSLSSAFASMGAEHYVSLTTFRRNGVGVPTAVWVAQDADALVVTTGAASGKVKRIRNEPRVELRPCSRSGRVEDGAPVVTGVAEVVTDDARAARMREPIAAKYGLQYRAMTTAGRIAATLGRRPASTSVILRITKPTSGA